MSDKIKIGLSKGKYKSIGHDNVFIGINAGVDIKECSNVLIVGDNIRSLDKSQENVLFIGDRVAFGETIFGQKINIKEIIEEFILKYSTI